MPHAGTRSWDLGSSLVSDVSGSMFVRGIFRLAAFAAVIAVSVVIAAAQDLGSSNKLFGGGSTKKAPTKTTVKKPAKRSKPAAAQPKTATRKSRTSARSTSSKTSSKRTPAATGDAAKKPAETNATPAEDWSWRNEIKTAEPAKQASAPKNTVSSAAADEQFEDLIDEGNRARDYRNYPAAEAAYTRARELKAKDSRAIYGLGNLYSDQQRWAEAEDAYREALRIESGFAITHIALSYVLTQPVPAENLSERYEEAEQLARRAIQYAPSNALAHDQLGVAMELRGIVSTETENAYRRAIQLDPAFAPAYAHLGRLLRRNGKMDESASAYRTAVRLATDPATMTLVADVMQSEQRFAESEQLLQKVIASDPRNPSGLLLLGRALMAQNKFDRAEDVLKTSLEVSPNAFVANTMLGSLYLRQSKLDLAENSLLQALRFVPQVEKRLLSRQFESLGDALLRSGNARFAERNFRQAQALDADNASAAAKLARVR